MEFRCGARVKLHVAQLNLQLRAAHGADWFDRHIVRCQDGNDLLRVFRRGGKDDAGLALVEEHLVCPQIFALEWHLCAEKLRPGIGPGIGPENSASKRFETAEFALKTPTLPDGRLEKICGLSHRM